MLDVIDRTLLVAVASLLAFIATRDAPLVVADQHDDETCPCVAHWCEFDEPMHISVASGGWTPANVNAPASLWNLW